MVDFNELSNYARSLDSNVEVLSINIEDIEFEKRVALKCFYCSKYNKQWTCPPRIPKLDYQALFKEYTQAAAVCYSQSIDEETYDLVRRETTVILHKILLELESFLWSKGEVMYITFIGGSCKLCKNGCFKDECKNPGKARIPLEATGMNIIKTMGKYGKSITFPPKEKMERVGMILW